MVTIQEKELNKDEMRPYQDVIRDYPFVQFTVFGVHEQGAAAIAQKIYDELKGFKKVYISTCIDIFDPAFAPGNSYDEPMGLTPHQVLTLVRKIWPISCAYDICEVTPPSDKDEVTSALAALFMFECFITMFNQ